MMKKTTNYGKSKIPVNLDNYPNLKKYSEESPQDFLETLKSVFSMVDSFYGKGYFQVADKYFEKPFHEVSKELLEGFFDTEGILSKHGQEGQGKVLFAMYGHTEHPLHAALTRSEFLDREWKEITFEEKYMLDRGHFSIKDWVQNLLFLSYYFNVEDINKALSLNNHVLLGDSKAKYLSRLLKVSPVFQHQYENGILVGKMIKGTGYFETGVPFEDVEQCPCCGGLEFAQSELNRDVFFCKRCSAGFFQTTD